MQFEILLVRNHAPASRTLDGVAPDEFRKTWIKLFSFRNPEAAATCLIGFVIRNNKSFARQTLPRP